MRKATLSLPGKTFLAGEYLALMGGPAFILCTEPRFQLRVTEQASPQSPFHPQSPAGKLYTQHQDIFSRYHFEFRDPYVGLGGFGASSAQFGLLHAVLQMGEEIFGESQLDLDWHQTLTEYRHLCREGKSLPPSGADLVGTLIGGLAFFDRNTGHSQRFAWPFSKISFSLFHTGKKLATHEHLRDLKIFETQQFQAASLEILKGLSLVQEETFLAGLKSYRDELFRQKKVTEGTALAVDRFQLLPQVVAAKGCGALGSDVLLVIHTGGAQEVHELGRELGMRWIASDKNLSSGLLTQNDHSSATETLSEIHT